MSPKLKILPVLLLALSMKLPFPAVRAVVLTSSLFLTWNIPDSEKAPCWACPLQIVGSKSKTHVRVRIQASLPSRHQHLQMCVTSLCRSHLILRLSSVSGTNMSLFLSECFLCSITSSLATDSISFLLWPPGSSKPCYKFYHTNHFGLDFWDNYLPSCSQGFSVFHGLVSGGSKKSNLRCSENWEPEGLTSFPLTLQRTFPL